jgi:hypothetical protein
MYLDALWPSPGNVDDFCQDWGSARNYLRDLPVYTEHAVSIPRHLGFAADPASTIERNAHPPATVLLVLPLAFLTYSQGFFLWNMISLVALLMSLWIVARELSAPRDVILPGAALLVFCHPLYAHLRHGQWTLLLLFLITSAWALDRRGKNLQAGGLLALAAAFKLFPAFLFLIYAVNRRIKPIFTGMAVFLLINLVGLALLGYETYRTYLGHVLPNQYVFRGFAYNLSVAGFWHRLFDPIGEAGRLLPLLRCPFLARFGSLATNFCLTALVIALASRARTSGQRDSVFGLAASAMLLVSPVTWDFSLPLLLLPLAVIHANLGRSRLRAVCLETILLVIWVPQELLTTLVGGSSATFSPYFSLGVASAKFYALIATFTLSAADLLKWERPVSSQLSIPETVSP